MNTRTWNGGPLNAALVGLAGESKPEEITLPWMEGENFSTPEMASGTLRSILRNEGVEI